MLDNKIAKITNLCVDMNILNNKIAKINNFMCGNEHVIQ